jgi:pimeloyl-ACP methyl ester carboxylesterase
MVKMANGFFVKAIVAAIAIFSTAWATPALAQPADPAAAQLGDGFVSETVEVNGVALHFVRGGAGPAVVLLHGFPQNWYAFHRVMPRLARTFTVIAVDMRGIGRSSVIAGAARARRVSRQGDSRCRSDLVARCKPLRAAAKAGTVQSRSVPSCGSCISRENDRWARWADDLLSILRTQTAGLPVGPSEFRTATTQ